MTHIELSKKVKEANDALGHTDASGKKFKVIYNMNKKYSLLFGTEVLMEFNTAEDALAHLENLVEEK